jgi:hypothetical protein
MIANGDVVSEFLKIFTFSKNLNKKDIFYHRELRAHREKN